MSRATSLNSFIWGGLLLVGTTVGAFSEPAQQDSPLEKVAVPPPPYLIAAPTNASWLVTMEGVADESGPKSNSTQAAKNKGKVLKEIDAVKAGDTRREMSIFTDGSSAETWFFKGVQLVIDPQAGYAVAIDCFGSSPPSPAALDFIEFAWVGSTSFRGKTMKGGEACYQYRYVDSISGPQTAWIDIKTGLPVAYEDSLGLKTYKFSPPTEMTLSLPPVYQAAYDRHLKQARAARDQQASIPR